jgi:hypothetical protein
MPPLCFFRESAIALLNVGIRIRDKLQLIGLCAFTMNNSHLHVAPRFSPSTFQSRRQAPVGNTEARNNASEPSGSRVMNAAFVVCCNSYKLPRKHSRISRPRDAAREPVYPLFGRIVLSEQSSSPTFLVTIPVELLLRVARLAMAAVHSCEPSSELAH